MRMATYDPTSLAHSLPTQPGRSWTARQVAQLQREVTVAAAATADHGSAAAPSAVALSSAGATAGVQQERTVSGRYRATAGQNELELRVDIDGARPTLHVSGDFFRRTGGTVTHVGSFIVNAPSIVVTSDSVVIEGEGVFSFDSTSPRLRVNIPTAGGTLGPPPAATAQFLTPGGVPAASYVCTFESPYFRTLEFELDRIQGIEPLGDYDTGRLTSGGPRRVLTVPTAYAEAGIEMVQMDPGDDVPLTAAGSDRIWTDSELHGAMWDHFSRWGTDPAWRVWLLAATIHEQGQGLRGVMFDSDKRQGCAVFHDVVGGSGDRVVRAMLRTYMHELGHCFNLYHSHHKEYMTPPRPNRLDALSYMHYPAYYQNGTASGEAAYWRAFPFQFDDDEVVHLRHAFRDAIIPGGQPFGLGAADVDPSLFADRIRDESGLRLELRAPDHALLGTPIVVEIKLSLTDLRGRTVNSHLHPKKGFVQIGISRQDGKTMLYRPLLTQCVEPALVTLDETRSAIYDSAYIGYGKDGFYFGAPGLYELRATYQAPDGSTVVSNRLRLHIKPPLGAQDAEMADLFFGEDQGTLLYLLGSDNLSLKGGNDAFALARDKHATHPLTSYACLVQGINSARTFKHIEGRSIRSRPVQSNTAETLLSAVIDSAVSVTGLGVASDGGTATMRVPRLDNISLQMVMGRLAKMRLESGDTQGAERATQDMWTFFARRQAVPNSVQTQIKKDIDGIIGEERAAQLAGALGPKTAASPRVSSPRAGRGQRRITLEGD
jgi:hypothetical protein